MGQSDEPTEIKKLQALLIASRYYKFPEKGGVKSTVNHGVYIIFSPENKVLHVGRTYRGRKGLNQRLDNHLNNLSSFSIAYLNKNGRKLRSGYKFKYLEIEDGRTRALVEALTTGLLCPSHIGTGERLKYL